MHPEDAPGVAAVRSDLLAEAGGQSGVLDGQRGLGDPLVAVEGRDRLLRGGDQILLVHGLVVRLLTGLAGHLLEGNDSNYEKA